MPQLGVAEILVIVIIALVLFGPNRLPELARQVAKGLRELRQVQEHLKGEIDDVMGQFDLHGSGDPAGAAAHEEDAVDHDVGVDVDEVEFPGGPPAAALPPAEVEASPPPVYPNQPAAPAAAPSRFRAPRPSDGGTRAAPPPSPLRAAPPPSPLRAAPAPSRFRAPRPTA
ncbi:MAG: twin-arginine translocase TatA/TatE family subunit [Acidimicrobiia bacterium]